LLLTGGEFNILDAVNESDVCDDIRQVVVLLGIVGILVFDMVCKWL